MEYEDDGTKPLDQVARTARALGNGSRLRLLVLLAQGERSVQDLAATAGLNVTTTSAHLQGLREVGLVASRRRGTHVIYRLAGDDVAALLVDLVDVSTRRHPAASAALAADVPDDVTELMNRSELVAAVESGRVTVVDVRPAAEYAHGHLPGAVSLPLDVLLERLDELPRDQEVVAYCRGRVCELSHTAAALLRDRGFRATATTDGVLEWRADGVRLERQPDGTTADGTSTDR